MMENGSRNNIERVMNDVVYLTLPQDLCMRAVPVLNEILAFQVTTGERDGMGNLKEINCDGKTTDSLGEMQRELMIGSMGQQNHVPFSFMRLRQIDKLYAEYAEKTNLPDTKVEDDAKVIKEIVDIFINRKFSVTGNESNSKKRSFFNFGKVFGRSQNNHERS